VGPRAIVLLVGLGQLKKEIHLIGTLTGDLPACSIVPQPTTLPRAPYLKVRSSLMNKRSLVIVVQRPVEAHPKIQFDHLHMSLELLCSPLRSPPVIRHYVDMNHSNDNHVITFTTEKRTGLVDIHQRGRRGVQR
jgi:hypothetical protein